MKHFDLIEDYLFNRLSEEDRVSFEKELTNNEVLAKELALQRIEFDIIDQMEEDDLRTKAASWKKKLETSETSQKSTPETKEVKLINKKRYLLPILAIAASLLLFIGIIVPNFITPQPNILAQAYEGAKLEYTVTLLQKGDEGNNIFKQPYLQILEKRNKEKAKDAISYFSTFSSDVKIENTRAKVNLGHAYILEEDFQSAIDVFTKIENDPDTPNRIREEVHFFKGIALIKTENNKNGVQILMDIQKENGRYGPLAKKIIEVL